MASSKLNIMDEKKSVLTNNQAIENLEQDFTFAKWTNGLTENVNDAAIKHYNRDILLQLRLHPLSLQKPIKLPEMEVIKDKLNLHDITDMTSASSEKQMDASNHHPSVKSEYCNMKSDFPSLSPYFNRAYPYNYSSHTYNGSYQGASMKSRSTLNSFCNSLKKHYVSPHQCLKDFSMDECSWLKHFSSSDDIWNCYSNHVSSGSYKRKDHLEAIPKSKKKLQIIDPVTGKNVLETVLASQPEESPVEAKSIENHVASKELCGDYFCNTVECNEEHTACKSHESRCESVSFSSGDKTCFEESKNNTAEHLSDGNIQSTTNGLEMTCDDASSVVDNIKNAESNNKKNENDEASEIKANMFNYTKTSQKVHKYDASKYKQMPKVSHNREMNTHFDVHGTCRAHPIKECSFHLCNENISKQHDTMQESLRQLREKIYSVKQEEQKVAILQSFLRYKKYQLEESARNLDEKRIEIANWEYNLYNKTKSLQEKEHWLENKNEVLNNKAQQLVEKEKTLSEEVKISGDTLYSNIFKETEVPEKKFTFDKNDTIWNEISKIKNPRMHENNDYSFDKYGSNSSKVPEIISSNVDKCKSDTFSLDELEINIALIEKMSTSDEVNENPENKIKLDTSSNATLKDGENTSYDALGYSKGRRYLPEHIKYWLDKRDKSAL